MASIKVVLRGNSLYLQAIHKRVTKRKKLLKIDPNHWVSNKVDKLDPNHHRKNLMIQNALNEITERILKLDSGKASYTVEELFEDNKTKTVSYVLESYPPAEKHQLVRKYKNVKDKIISYGDIPISQINKKYVKGFIRHLEEDEAINSNNTIGRYLKFLLTAIKAYDVDPSIFTIKKPSQKVNKPIITFDEYNAISVLDLIGREDASRDLFIAMITQAGTRIGDILRLTPTDVKNGFYLERKTKKRKDIMNSETFQNLIEKYEGLSNYYTFPVLTLEPEELPLSEKFDSHIESKTALINKDLKLIAVRASISINLTTSTARHSFASWGNHQGISINLMKDLLNHSSTRTTEQYIKSLNEQAELEAAVNSILQKN